MRAYLTRRNLILAAIAALILFYSHTLALLAYLIIMLVVGVVWRWRSDRGVKMANFTANTALVTITLLSLVVLLEISLYLKPHFFTGDSSPDILGEFSDFTSRGYLSEAVLKKPKGGFRILGLGDSFAVRGVEEKKNYHDFLQEKLSSLGRGQLEVVNAGMPGVGPGYYWQILEHCGDRFQPNLVLVGFFIGNDFSEWQMFITIGNFIIEPKDWKQKLWEYRKIKNLRVIKLTRTKYIYFQEQRRQVREAKARGFLDEGTFSEQSFLDVYGNQSQIFDKNNRAALERNWRHCAQIVTQMKQWCDDRRVDLVLMIFPDRFQVDGELRARVMEKYHLAAASLDLGYPDSMISNYCRENHIHCLDLLPPFQEKGKSTQLYALRDTHWNEAGNRLAAELIFNYLEDHNLIKVD